MSNIIASTYEIIEKIGSGGGGTVYLANHLRLNKKVVLKADKRKITARPELLRREVDILKNLSHSYIPQVYDFFIEDGTVYTVMDYIQGESLDIPLKRGEKFTQDQVIKWAKQMLEALCYLHSPIHGEPAKGYVHSDIKPANLIRTPQNNICLIDFNIALALGDETVVGRSAGYASPEHYGLDFTSVSGMTTIHDDVTVALENETETITLSALQSSQSFMRKVVPDVRSDIYSVGATLYHLLSGKRPAKYATEVVPLSAKEFSPQIIKIISKAMNVNPDMRYQTAEEMLKDLCSLHDNDPRTKKLKRNKKIVLGVWSVLLGAGILSTFIGLKRMQISETWLKSAEYSENALSEGDIKAALEYALNALPQNKNLLTPDSLPEVQKALTDALGVYDLSDGWKKYKTLELPNSPLHLEISPEGKTAVCVYDANVAVIDTETAEIIVTFPAEDSALSTAKYLNENIVIYAGRNGISAYDISQKKELWTGEQATSISIAEEANMVAAVYKDATSAIVYDALSGEMKYIVDFEGHHQNVSMVSDNFADPNYNLFALNNDGKKLAVSFVDGSLIVYDLQDSAKDLILLGESSGYVRFEGGFSGNYFAFSAANDTQSMFSVIDVAEKIQTIGFMSDSMYRVTSDEKGIFVQSGDVQVKMDPLTGEQTAVENVVENNAADYIRMAGETAISGKLDSTTLQIMKFEQHTENNVFTYDAGYEHDEARMSADGKNMMLFSYKGFRLYEMGGVLINEVEFPDPEHVYNQEYVREEGKSYLKTTYSDGTCLTYDAAEGELLSVEQGEIPDMTLCEEFTTDAYRIEAPLQGNALVYDKETDELLYKLEQEAFLIYVTQVENYIITQYVTADGLYCGILLNDKCEELAYLPYLSDIVDGELYFDYPSGNIRKSAIYDLNTLIRLAEKEVNANEE